MVRLKIMDYTNNWHDTGIDVDDSVSFIEIEVLSGDHIAHITFSDGSTETIDSCFSRVEDFEDGNIVIFDREHGIDYVKDYLSIKKSSDIFDLGTATDKRLDNIEEWFPQMMSNLFGIR